MLLQQNDLRKDLKIVLEAAKRRFLEPSIILKLIQYGMSGQLPTRPKVQHKPQSGAVFLYSKSEVENYRVDGHDYVRKKDSLAVRQDTVKLRLEGQERIYACHVHSAKVKTFHRRLYWDMQNKDNIILVHYLDTEAGPVRHTSCDCLACCLSREEKNKQSKSVTKSASKSGGSLTRNLSSTASTTIASTSTSCSSSSSFVLPPDLNSLEPITMTPNNVSPDKDTDSEDLRDFLDFVNFDIGCGNTIEDRSSKVTKKSHASFSIPTAEQLFVENYAPSIVEAEGGTKMLFALARRSGEPMSLPSRSLQSLPIVVAFGKKTNVVAALSSNGVVTCRAPPMPHGTCIEINVFVNGMKVVYGPGLQHSTVRYLIEKSNVQVAKHHREVCDGKSSPVKPEFSWSRSTLRDQDKCCITTDGGLNDGQNRCIFPHSAPCAQVRSVTPTQEAARRILKRKWNRSTTALSRQIDSFESADVNALSEDELTELGESLLERVVRVMVQMMKEEKDLVGEMDALDDSGFNLLHYTVTFSHEKLVSLLLEYGADPNIKTSTGDTPLHLAAEQGDMSIAKKLVKAGADPFAVDPVGQSCTDLARKYNFFELADWFAQFSKQTTTPFSLESWDAIDLLPLPPTLPSPPFSSPKSSPSSYSAMEGQVPHYPSKILRTASTGDLCTKESREDKQNKMLRKALASMSLKDRCALSLGIGGSSATSPKSQSPQKGNLRSVPESTFPDYGHIDMDSSSLEEGFMRSPPRAQAHRTRVRSESDLSASSNSSVKRIVSEDESALQTVISAMHDDERSELEDEARIIQDNFRKWMLRRGVMAAQRVQTETSGYLANKGEKDSLQHKATKVQALGKGFLARRQFSQAVQDVIQVQAATRCLLARKNFKSWRRQLSATLVIQRSIRAHQQRLKEGSSIACTIEQTGFPLNSPHSV